MDIAFIGLGKLGLPVASAIAQKGHKVWGYDVDSSKLERCRQGEVNPYEPGIDLKGITFTSNLKEAVRQGELIFIAVQTPHPPEMDGSARFHHIRQDFEYSFLVDAARSVAEALREDKDYKVVAIISTVLPGTTRERIYPIMKEVIGKHRIWDLCYNPSFVAMGQVVQDFLYPEFTLIGAKAEAPAQKLAYFYSTIHNAPKLRMSWEEAELVKMCYNTYIGFKIIVANTVMQMCHQLSVNCDVVLGALKQATDRIVSSAYMRGGSGDGGPCHPRDNLALAYLSDKLGLGYNLFDFIMTVREEQTKWLADLMCQYNLPKVILGMSYKVGVNLIDGSASILLGNILKERGEQVSFHDPAVLSHLWPKADFSRPSVFLLGTPWPEYKNCQFPKGSVIIDPWGFLDKASPGVKLIRVGRR